MLIKVAAMSKKMRHKLWEQQGPALEGPDGEYRKVPLERVDPLNKTLHVSKNKQNKDKGSDFWSARLDQLDHVWVLPSHALMALPYGAYQFISRSGVPAELAPDLTALLPLGYIAGAS